MMSKKSTILCYLSFDDVSVFLIIIESMKVLNLFVCLNCSCISHRITGFLDFSIVWYSTEYDVSETGSVSALR
jgi:hypothetical protein